MPTLNASTAAGAPAAPSTPAAASEAIQTLALQIRIHDAFGTYQRWSNELLLKPYVLTREKKRSISLEGPVEPATIGRLQAFFRSVAYRIEMATGVMARLVLDLNDEGFGYALVVAGKLVVVNRSLRDAHRFGFASLEDLQAESDKLTAQGIATVERFAEAARS